ncbi:hypothetical protein PG996_008612 [Apiospora saccharicola]|uniref:F-box domain-containing protein n=1 Tax=Apiospora saccharicola TaxID=335842 RepID=A0ABR1UYF5_9PEZI
MTKKPVKDLFAKLADEIVLKILHDIDDKISLLALRQTCRQLRRLCEDPTLEYKLPILLGTAPLSPPPYKYFGVEAEVIHSPWLGESSFADKCRLRYREVLWRNRICDDCAELRRDPDVYRCAVVRIYKPKRCSGCKAHHPAFLFSYLERQKDAGQRVCIGRQGHIRLCAHRTISYEKATQIFNKYPPIYLKGHNGPYNQDPKYLYEMKCSVCSSDTRKVAATFRREGKLTAYKQIDISHTLKDTSWHKNKGMPNFVQKMLGRKPELSTCIHSGDLKSVLPALLQEQERKSRGGKIESACHMPDCASCAQVDNNGGVTIGAYKEVISETPTDPRWLVALDPQSYLSDADELTRGLMWCRDPACGVTKRGRALYKVFHQFDLPHEVVSF